MIRVGRRLGVLIIVIVGALIVVGRVGRIHLIAHTVGYTGILTRILICTQVSQSASYRLTVRLTVIKRPGRVVAGCRWAHLAINTTRGGSRRSIHRSGVRGRNRSAVSIGVLPFPGAGLGSGDLIVRSVVVNNSAANSVGIAKPVQTPHLTPITSQHAVYIVDDSTTHMNLSSSIWFPKNCSFMAKKIRPVN